MPLQNNDRFVVQRGSTLYKVPSSELKIEYSSDPTVYIGENPPFDPVEGTLWWSTLEGNLFIWYDDGDSQQWVDASPAFIDIDYTRIESYIDQSVQDNAVAQLLPGTDITLNPADGKGVVTVGFDRSFLTEDQDRQDREILNLNNEIDRLNGVINDLADRLDQLEDEVAGLNTIDGGYPNAEGIFDEPELLGGTADPASQINPDLDGGNAEGYD